MDEQKLCSRCKRNPVCHHHSKYCSECRDTYNKEYRHRWYLKNKEEHKKRREEYYNENKEHLARKHKEYYKKNKERISLKSKERHILNQEEENKKARLKYQKNRNKILKEQHKENLALIVLRKNHQDEFNNLLRKNLGNQPYTRDEYKKIYRKAMHILKDKYKNELKFLIEKQAIPKRKIETTIKIIGEFSIYDEMEYDILPEFRDELIENHLQKIGSYLKIPRENIRVLRHSGLSKSFTGNFVSIKKRKTFKKALQDYEISVTKSGLTIGAKVLQFLNKDFAEIFINFEEGFLALKSSDDNFNGYKINKKQTSIYITTREVGRNVEFGVYEGEVEGEMLVFKVKIKKDRENIQRDLGGGSKPRKEKQDE